MNEIKMKKRLRELKKMGHENGVYDFKGLAELYGVSESTAKRYMQSKYRANIDRFQAHNEEFNGKVYGKFRPQWVVPIDIAYPLFMDDMQKEIDLEALDEAMLNSIKNEYRNYCYDDLLVEIAKLRQEIDELENDLIIARENSK